MQLCREGMDCGETSSRETNHPGKKPEVLSQGRACGSQEERAEVLRTQNLLDMMTYWIEGVLERKEPMLLITKFPNVPLLNQMLKNTIELSSLHLKYDIKHYTFNAISIETP